MKKKGIYFINKALQKDLKKKEKKLYIVHDLLDLKDLPAVTASSEV